jgi:predicted nucleotidyltransferase component of viral defense system
MITQTDLLKYGRIYKTDQYTVLREFLQIVFLNSLYKQKESSSLIFKGGTAIRLVYNSPRFSEDLDFNSTLKINTLKGILEKSLYDSNKIFSELSIKDLKATQGYSAKIYFKSEIFPMPLTVKLDFSMREDSFEYNKSTISTDLPVSGFSLIFAMTEKEILAEKFRTIYQRKKGRDIFDIWYLLNKKVLVDKKLVNQKFKLLDKKFSMEDVKKQIMSFDQSVLEKDLIKYLPLNQRHLPSDLRKIIIQKL